ncbi:MAG: hypothetical protein HZC42_03480 [Candidatus Eisenbacteria bacterium]|nr:hypothetical protein [Candidatus Eisenbacteria bacterium]
MLRRALLLTLALALAGCSTRARLNPFDPANPGTGGRPAGFVAMAGYSAVTLRWQAVTNGDLLGYQVFRRLDGDSAFQELTGLLPARTTTLGDFGTANGVAHHYRLYFVFTRGLGTLPAEDAATPGPMRPWIADYTTGQLVRLTPDSRHIAESVGYPGAAGPSAVEVAPASGRVWACGPAGDVMIYDPADGTTRLIGSGASSPVALALDRQDGSVWVADAGAGEVRHFDANGAPAPPGALAPLATPLSLALDPGDRSLWVVEADGNRVRKYAADGVPLGAATVDAPSRVAVDAVTHEAWVTSLQGARVVRLSRGVVPQDTVEGFGGPIGVAVDGERGRVWVADAAGDQVVALRRDGSVEFRVGGQAQPRELAVDPYSGEAWVTLASAGAVSRLSPAGAEIGRTGGIAGAYAIALDDASLRASTAGPAPLNAPPPPSSRPRRRAG